MPAPLTDIERLGQLLPLFMDLINRRSAGQTMRIMHECGLTLPQMVALHVLRHATPLSLQGLTDHLQLSPSATSTLVDKLVAKGFVDRTENPDDRRQKRIELTPAGAELLDRLALARAAEFSGAVAAVDPQLRAELVTLFERVIAQLSAGESPCRPPVTNPSSS